MYKEKEIKIGIDYIIECLKDGYNIYTYDKDGQRDCRFSFINGKFFVHRFVHGKKEITEEEVREFFSLYDKTINVYDAGRGDLIMEFSIYFEYEAPGVWVDYVHVFDSI